MKTLNTAFRLIIAFILFNSTILAQLDLSVYTDKESYEYGETIKLYAKVTNTSDTTFEFLAGNYETCHAEFSFNDFNSWEYAMCLPTEQMLTFKPHHSKIYSWRIEPQSLGLPNKDGSQTIIGKYYFDLADTIYIQAPKFIGGEIRVAFNGSDIDSIHSIRNQLNANLIFADYFEDVKGEVWQIEGFDIDSLIQIYSIDSIFVYFEKSVVIGYEKMVDENPFDYYPLQVGNYWQYEVEKRGLFPSDSADWIAYTEVIGDTTMPNGQKYFVLNENGMSLNNQLTNKKYIRIDSSKVNVYEYRYDNEFLVDSLQMEIGDEFDCLGLADIYFKNVFGINSQIRFYNQTCVTTTGWFTHELAKNFGKVHSVFTETNVYAIDFEFDLVYTIINGQEYGKLVDVNSNYNSPEIPTDFSLSQNYPNPFNPTTTIEYTIPLNLAYRQAGEKRETKKVKIIVNDILGEKVATLVNETQSPGKYLIVFDASNLTSGIYYYSLLVNNNIQTRKMILLK